MFLTSTSDILRLVTASGVSTITVHASWVDLSGGVATPGRTNTNITTATTTTVVAAPASSTVRNIRSVKISNNHATDACVITIQHYDGTTSIDIEKITLKAGEAFVMSEDGEWRHLTSVGAEYENVGPTSNPNLGIAGTVAETFPRQLCPEANVNVLTSGTLTLVAVHLKVGQVVSNISFFSGSTAANGPTNQFFALYSRLGQLLASSANDTTTAWAANTIKTLAMQSAYTVRKSDIYFIGIMVTASSAVPNLKGQSMGTQLGAYQQAIRGNSTSSLTTVLPDPAAVPTAGASVIPWAAIT